MSRRRNPRAVAAYLWKYYVPFFLWFPMAYYAYGTLEAAMVTADNQAVIMAYFEWRLNRLENSAELEHITQEQYVLKREQLKTPEYDETRWRYVD